MPSVSIRGHALAFESAGDPRARTPVICVPGGPGVPGEYLRPLIDRLIALGRPVVWYDPLGSGRSARPDTVDWSIALFVEELSGLRRELGLDRVHLFSHSAGGFTVFEYLLGQPTGVASVVVCGTPVDVPRYEAEIRKRIATLSAETQAALAAPKRDAPYARAFHELAARHICRLAPMPPGLVLAMQRKNRAAYEALRSRDGELFYSGSLARWSVFDRLGELALPVLVTCGRHDIMAPEHCAEIAAAIPGAALEVFEQSSHVAFAEQPDEYAAAVERFFARHDASS